MRAGSPCSPRSGWWGAGWPGGGWAELRLPTHQDAASDGALLSLGPAHCVQSMKWCDQGIYLLASQPVDKCQSQDGAEAALQEIEKFLETGAENKIQELSKIYQDYESILTKDLMVSGAGLCRRWGAPPGCAQESCRDLSECPGQSRGSVSLPTAAPSRPVFLPPGSFPARTASWTEQPLQAPLRVALTPGPHSRRPLSADPWRPHVPPFQWTLGPKSAVHGGPRPQPQRALEGGVAAVSQAQRRAAADTGGVSDSRVRSPCPFRNTCRRSSRSKRAWRRCSTGGRPA